MFKKHNNRRSTNIVFVIFRLILSVVMFTALLAGVMAAYKHFSGLDPLKLDYLSTLKELIQKQTIPNLPIPVPAGTGPANDSAVSFKFLLIADSHSDNTNLQKAIQQAKQTFPDLAFMIGLGDYTEVGTIDELKKAKVELDSSGLRYFLLVGDHDLWDARDKGNDPADNFRQVFGLTYQSFIFNNFKFLLINNSDNYNGLSLEQQNWITEELEKVRTEKISAIYAFVHEPLYHPSSDHFMGRVEKEVKKQAEVLTFQLKMAGVKEVFSGDIHYFSQYEEPVTKLPMRTIGAITTERNPQTPRFAIVSVFADGNIKVEDVEIK